VFSSVDAVLNLLPRGSVPLLLMVGLPGSGKSTWVAQFLKTHPDYRSVSTDDCRERIYGDASAQGDWRQVWACVQAEWQQGLGAIAQGTLTGLIYDATNARRRYRGEAITAARQWGFSAIVLVWIDVPLSVALERNRQRPRQVPDEVIATMHRRLQVAPPEIADGADYLVRLDHDDLHP
jgi:predicted kinase